MSGTTWEPPRGAWAPLKIGVAWMLGTFVAWLLLGDTSGLDDWFLLVTFIGIDEVLQLGRQVEVPVPGVERARAASGQT